MSSSIVLDIQRYMKPLQHRRAVLKFCWHPGKIGMSKQQNQQTSFPSADHVQFCLSQDAKLGSGVPMCPWIAHWEKLEGHIPNLATSKHWKMDSTNPLDQPVASNLKILEEGLNHEVTQYLPHQFPKCTSASIITIPIREFQLLASLAGTDTWKFASS